MKSRQRQTGFTLVEIAIVLVIIGLLLGGILKGQELINSARVKNLANDFRTIPTYIYGYQDKFRALPGDDSGAVPHVSAPAGNIGNGNGTIDGAWNADETSTTIESNLFWEHVRLANLAPGPTVPATGFAPVNAMGGRIGVTSATATQALGGLTGTYMICSDAIPGKFAKQLDIQMDDGDTAKGSMRVVPAGETNPATAAVQTTAIVEGTNYAVCMAF